MESKEIVAKVNALISRRDRVKLDANEVLAPFSCKVLESLTSQFDDLPLYKFSMEARERK